VQKFTIPIIFGIIAIRRCSDEGIGLAENGTQPIAAGHAIGTGDLVGDVKQNTPDKING
jgi:hypothetical protein